METHIKWVPMDTRHAFAKALRQARRHKRLSQEDFSDVSSRTYLSSLERALKSPTLEKIDQLAGVLGIHPVTLLAMVYGLKDEARGPSGILEIVAAELDDIERATPDLEEG